MPYKLRKVPKKDLYWVVGEDGKHHSKEGLPLERAKAQMAALYSAMRKEGGSLDISRYNEWASRKPMPEAKWIAQRKLWAPDTATHEDYLELYLKPFNSAPALMSYKYVPGVDTAQKCPAGAVKITSDADAAKLPPGTRWCIENPADGSTSQGTTKTQAELDHYAQEHEQMVEQAKRNRQIAEDKYWDEHPVSKFFNKTLVNGLIKFNDTALNVLPIIAPELKPILSPLSAVYKNFAPPGSEFHKEGSFTDKAIKTGAQLMGIGHMHSLGGKKRKPVDKYDSAMAEIEKRFQKEKRTGIYPDAPRDWAHSVWAWNNGDEEYHTRVRSVGLEPPAEKVAWKESGLSWAAWKKGVKEKRAELKKYHGGGHAPSTLFKKQLERAGISPAAYLAEAQRKAKAKGLAWKMLGFSDDQKHKLQIPNEEGKLVRFGSVRLGDHVLYSLAHDPSANEHRRRYLARATKIKGAWAKDPYSANSLAIHILW